MFVYQFAWSLISYWGYALLNNLNVITKGIYSLASVDWVRNEVCKEETFMRCKYRFYSVSLLFFLIYKYAVVYEN